MALSNIFREPRREITETVVGVAAVFGLAYLDYRFAMWLQDTSGGWNHLPWPLGMLLGAGGATMVVTVVVLVHVLGEAVCDSLEDRGLRLRPRQRW